jgi:recombination protein RecT
MSAQTVTDAYAAKEAGIISVMYGEFDRFRAVLAGTEDEVKTFIGTAVAALYADPYLMAAAEASPDTLIVAMLKCAGKGHLPGTEEFYLTPRQIKGKPGILGIEGYRGVIERMYRSGQVASVTVQEVCARDPFRYVKGVDRVPVHSVGGAGETGADFFGEHGTRDRGEMVGVYAYAEMLSGAISRVVILNRDDVEAYRADGGWKRDDRFSPWNRLDAGEKHPEFRGRSMWLKSGVKRLEPWAPTSKDDLRARGRAAAAITPAPALPPPSAAVNGGQDTRAIQNHAPAIEQGRGAATTGTPARASKGQLTILGQQFTRLGYEDPGQRTEALSILTGRKITAETDLSRDECQDVSDRLRPVKDTGSLIAMLGILDPAADTGGVS